MKIGLHDSSVLYSIFSVGSGTKVLTHRIAPIPAATFEQTVSIRFNHKSLHLYSRQGMIYEYLLDPGIGLLFIGIGLLNILFLTNAVPNFQFVAAIALPN
jgi:hypothetical protein